ncbi:NAD(P)H-quinone dehydrogenase [Spongisporangium articulatum]|uniref:NAD(P)H-quinone dehydrogenase n=1 Tax=Spongisporangium articulatum TaxID=3362603 RepID=A0ABW8APK0_9ACTN
MSAQNTVVIIGGGPGGYEAALVAAQLGAEVTVVERAGLGGAAVLTDVVPSKTLIATAEVLATVAGAGELGITGTRDIATDLGAVNARVRRLAAAQSGDITARLEKEGVHILSGTGRLAGVAGALHRVVATDATGAETELTASTVLVATGARPRALPGAEPDGERILNWTQLYGLARLPDKLIVVGSGVTGAEFASAYHALGAPVALVSSRDRVLPGEDPDAAELLERVFRGGGMEVLSRSRAQSVERTADGVVVTLADGRTVEGSHCLMAVGSLPNTEDVGLAEAGVTLKESGHIVVDRVSRTSAPGVYAAGDVTGVLALASVAAMQGRTAMHHALGDAVTPLNLRRVSSNVFTAPEIATVGATQAEVDAEGGASVRLLPLGGNPRAKMQGVHEGFVKVIASSGSGRVLGGVIVSPRASELIHPLTLAVSNRLTVDDVAAAFTVYPSLSGSVAEAARQLHTGS